jgi:hypothetical protein
VIDKSGDFYVDWAVFYDEINPSAANVAQREARNYKFAADDKLINYALERAATEKKPYIENLTARLIEEFSDFSQLSIEIAHGYRQFLVTALKSGGEALGILTFNSLRENHFESAILNCFRQSPIWSPSPSPTSGRTTKSLNASARKPGCSKSPN